MDDFVGELTPDGVEPCLACPPGCPECTRDDSDCECYVHADNHPRNPGADE